MARTTTAYIRIFELQHHIRKLIYDVQYLTSLNEKENKKKKNEDENKSNLCAAENARTLGHIVATARVHWCLFIMVEHFVLAQIYFGNTVIRIMMFTLLAN